MNSKLKRCMKVANYSERLWKLHAVWLVVKNYYVYLGQNIYPGLIKNFSRIIVFHFVHFLKIWEIKLRMFTRIGNWLVINMACLFGYWSSFCLYVIWCTCQEKIAFNTFSRNWNDKTWIKKLLFLYLIPFLRNLNVLFENVFINIIKLFCKQQHGNVFAVLFQLLY